MRQSTLKINSIRNAFTMVELVFVIVLVGILAAMAIPRLDRDIKQEAADSILADIRYTQHLALSDNKHSTDVPEWQRAFWKIGFNNCDSGSGIYEYIGSDTSYGGGISDEESATDPANGNKMNWSTSSDCSDGGDAYTSDRIFLTDKYGINAVTGETGTGCAGIKHIGFDHLGRPHVSFGGSDEPNYDSYMSQQCTFIFDMADGDQFKINIEPETGHAWIDEQPAS
jgi:prepilin-type N-terminal cleavage/methylation domain-containing protein